MIISINDKDYEFKYTINSLCKMSGAGIDVMGDGAVKIGSSISSLRKAFYYGLLEENSKMTEVRAGQLMDSYINEGHSIQDVFNLVDEAIIESTGMETEDDSTEENKDEEQGK